jgi:4-carboxymuconolactone decarboxylase
MTSSPRIAPLEPPYPDAIDALFGEIMPPGMPPLALFRTLAKNPRILRKVRDSNLLDRGSIERRDREIVILRATARCRSEYEWGVHVAVFAQRFGLSPAQVEATVRSDGDDPIWSARDALLIRLVDALHDTAALSDGLFDALAEHYDEEQLIELVVLAGFYHTISFVTNAFTIAPEADAPRFPR